MSNPQFFFAALKFFPKPKMSEATESLLGESLRIESPDESLPSFIIESSENRLRLISLYSLSCEGEAVIEDNGIP